MIEHLIEYVQVLVAQQGVWGVFLATLIEEIVAPIPSPLVPLAAGFFLLPMQLSWTESVFRSAVSIALPVSIGISIGSAVVYALGFFGGKPVIDSSKRWTGIRWQDVERIEERITRGKGDELMLFALRVVPVVPGVAISGFCGVVRYPFGTFLGITFIGAFLRALLLGVVGWRVGEVYAAYAGLISQFEKYILIAVALTALLVLARYCYVRYKMTP